MKTESLLRRECLLPGELLPDAPMGKHHGVVIRLDKSPDGALTAHVKLSDFRNLRLQLPAEKVQPHLLPRPERPPRPKFSRPAATAAPAAKPSKKHRAKVPQGVPLHGPPLQLHLLQLHAATLNERFPPGTRLWAKTCDGKWPGVAWSLALCKRRDIGALVLSHHPGTMLVRFYGQHSLMFVSPDKCEPHPEDPDGVEDLLRSLRSWGRAHNNLNLVHLAAEEMAGAQASPAAEVARVTSLYTTYMLQRMETDTCWLCRDGGAGLLCGRCDRRFHCMCLRWPAVSEDHLPDAKWECPCCFAVQAVEPPAPENPEEEEDVEVERMGLTPDWLISAAAFEVFKLERPTPARPYIPNLLDPCTNSKVAPNIPAEMMYDKSDDGLKLSNSWAGYHVLLNPDYKAQILWRFVNRCIDEVENGSVPAVILVARNSTDTAYFQRLRPYPRIMLRRTSARFKDYSKSPPGFGIAVFCVAQHHKRQLFADFVQAFQGFGEPTIPFDAQLLQSDEFYAQLARSKEYCAEHHRDLWVQCSRCAKWRIIDFTAAAEIGEEDDWTCASLRPPHTSCDTPLSRAELAGGHYAAKRVGEEYGVVDDDEQLQPAEAVQAVPLQPGKTEKHAIPAPPASIPETSVLRAITALPLRPLQEAASKRGPEAQVSTALELARQARIAANKAYLEHLQNNVSGAALPADHPAVLVAAREVARIAAMQACASQKVEAWQAYEHARRKRQQDEAPLLAALEEVRAAEAAARARWEAAQRAADEIGSELAKVVGGGSTSK